MQLQLQFGSGFFESAGQLVGVAAMVILLLMLVALGGFAYKSVRGDGIRWPDEIDEENAETEGIARQGDEDDEWKYY